MHAQQKIYTSIIIVLILYILHLDHESAYNGIMGFYSFQNVNITI